MFTSTGIFQYDPGKGTKKFTPHWGLLVCDDDIAAYYSWFLKKRGMPVQANDKGLWGAHVSVLKGEVPPKSESWGKYEGFEIEFHYTNQIRYENGKHAWVDVFSTQLSAIREELGFPFKPWYHLTVGRLVHPFDHLLDFSQDLT